MEGFVAPVPPPPDAVDAIAAEASRTLDAWLAVLRLPQQELAVTYDRTVGRASGAPLRPAVRKLLAVAQLNDSALPLAATLEHGGAALAVPIRDAQHRAVGALGVVRTAEAGPFTRQQSLALRELAERAGAMLTRRREELGSVLDRLEYDVRAAERIAAPPASRTPLALLHVDVDRLQALNERDGYAVGDALLREHARAIAAAVPAGSIVGRVAGDAFEALVPCDTVAAATALAASLVARLGGLGVQGPESVARCAVSAGVAPLEGSLTLDELRHRAELACRMAKEHGGARAVVYDALDASVVRREEHRDLVAAILEALHEDAFVLLAQPIVGFPVASAPSFEILLRMRQEGELLVPGQFLPAAERYGLLTAIDRWVVRRLLALLAPREAAVVACGARFAVNLSGASVADEEFAAFLDARLGEHPRLAPHLTFEFGEAAAAGRLKSVTALIARVRRHGCEFALDDFGVGPSTFEQLRALPVQRLKVDGTYVRDVAGDKVSQAMLQATCEVARSLGVEVVAEGVESDSARRRLQALSVGRAQGYLFGVPQPLEDALDGALCTVARAASA